MDRIRKVVEEVIDAKVVPTLAFLKDRVSHLERQVYETLEELDSNRDTGEDAGKTQRLEALQNWMF